MSSFTDTLTAVSTFLVNRAQLTRVTNHEELQRVAGKLLYNGGRRPLPLPVSREKIIEVLKAADAISMADKGVMLSVLVPHFFDNGITPRFFEQAVERGLLSEEADEETRQTFRQEMLAKVYLAYAAQIPDDLSELFPQPEDSEVEDYEDLDAEI